MNKITTKKWIKKEDNDKKETWEQKPDARPEERLIEDGGMKERRYGEREGRRSPSVP